jgi:hypothetical protein
MDERALILPPPPSPRLALWAVVNASFHRVAGAVRRALEGVAEAARRAARIFDLGVDTRLSSTSLLLAREGRVSALAARLLAARRS